MSLQKQIMTSMKEAMKSKDTIALEALRAIKSELLLAQTKSGAAEGLSEDEEIKLLQKLVKQRKDSAALYTKEGREDLAEPEIAQAEVISKFLPEQLSAEELEQFIEGIIAETGASSMADMGKVMGIASSKLAGKADGKSISTVVKAKLSK
ncbi:GatB/YqeY domain-containing protein [Aureivirga sp. CE67]|uniref:GatB/YqeY domain-containing protein n=1 Tax=Aureivirga sp. CE67 TaxID=1788983 RepID=UPI0018CAC0AB|nr:GatB/YqeY domain-containing protein [Aureivirga sp. CE67]